MNAMAALQSYAQVKTHSGVTDASPHRLIQMLFEGGLERIAQAKGAIQQNNVENRSMYINKAANIIGGLRGSLDSDQGGDLADNLDSLYDYMTRRLYEANRDSNLDILDEVGGLLAEIKMAWDQIADQVSA